MSVERWLTESGTERELRARVRFWLQCRLHRGVSDVEIDDAMVDYAIDMAIRAGRLDELVEAAADDDDEDTPLH